jgi:hypothetical protein
MVKQLIINNIPSGFRLKLQGIALKVTRDCAESYKGLRQSCKGLRQKYRLNFDFT